MNAIGRVRLYAVENLPGWVILPDGWRTHGGLPVGRGGCSGGGGLGGSDTVFSDGSHLAQSVLRPTDRC